MTPLQVTCCTSALGGCVIVACVIVREWAINYKSKAEKTLDAIAEIGAPPPDHCTHMTVPGSCSVRHRCRYCMAHSYSGKSFIQFGRETAHGSAVNISAINCRCTLKAIADNDLRETSPHENEGSMTE